MRDYTVVDPTICGFAFVAPVDAVVNIITDLLYDAVTLDPREACELLIAHRARQFDSVAGLPWSVLDEWLHAEFGDRH